MVQEHSRETQFVKEDTFNESKHYFQTVFFLHSDPGYIRSCVNKTADKSYLADFIELSGKLHNEQLALHQRLLLLKLHLFTRFLKQRNKGRQERPV